MTAAQLGWTQISRAAVQRAEAQLADGSEGVLDELGLLEVHQAYADRFFPGTSVLHTRLRYVLFVAWTYEDVLHRRTPPRNVEGEIASLEGTVGKALKRNTDSWGLIGRRTLPRVPAQRPSMMYWSALGTWGLLHKHPDGTLPSRVEIHARLGGRRTRDVHDDEGGALQRIQSPFIALPPRAEGWPSGVLDFRLSREEQGFLREMLGRVPTPDSDRLSVFARLANTRAGKRLEDVDGLLCREMSNVAEEDWPALQRADQAASLAAVVRGVFAAMVEEQACRDGLGDRDRCRANLREVVALHGDKALRLDMRLLRQDLGGRKRAQQIAVVLEQTQQWLAEVEGVRLDPALRNLYMAQERRRKGSRAKLSPTATAMRKEWWLDPAREGEPLSQPLHYRWGVTRNLLRDLENRE